MFAFYEREQGCLLQWSRFACVGRVACYSGPGSLVWAGLSVTVIQDRLCGQGCLLQWPRVASVKLGHGCLVQWLRFACVGRVAWYSGPGSCLFNKGRVVCYSGPCSLVWAGLPGTVAHVRLCGHGCLSHWPS
jgi:hypothetical protein